MSKNRDDGAVGAPRQIERETESGLGHPTSHDDQPSAEASRVREELAAQFLGVAPRSHQHSRKGQAESPRELNPNQPERKHDKNR